MNIVLKNFEFENVKNEYKALDVGIYNGYIKDVCITTSRSNKKMICVTVELIGEKFLNGAHLGGRVEKYYILLNDLYTASKLYSLLQACNIDVKVGDEINVEQLIHSNVLLNKNVYVKLKKSNYVNKDGILKECNNISYLKRFENSTVVNMNDSEHINKNVVENTLNDEDIPF